MKNFVKNTLKVMSLLFVVIGFFVALAGFSQSITRYHGEAFLPIGFLGIALMLNSVFILAFEYIVEAAIIYIEKNSESNSESE